MNPIRDLKSTNPRKTVPDRLLEGAVVFLFVTASFAILAPKIRMDSGESPRIATARAELSILTSGLQNFRLDCNRYPTTAEGLGALRHAPLGCAGWRGPYLTTPVPLDDWGKPYLYQCPGPNGKDSFLLESFGSDGKPGGEGEAADIVAGG